MKISYIQMSCVVLLVSIYFIGPVSCCSTDRDCGFNFTIGNKTIFYRIRMCCKYVSPRRCMNHQKCLDNNPWKYPTHPWKWWTSKPINPTRSWPDLRWTPRTYIIPSWTFPTVTYKPAYTSYDDGGSNSSNNSGVSPLVISLIVIFIILALPLAIAYRYCVSQTAARQSSQNVTSQSVGQREVTRNPHHIVMVISEDVRGSRVSQALADEPPSYEDVVTPSPPQYDDVPPPRYENNHQPPPPRYEDNHLPPPPRYEDVVNEDNAATSGDNTAPHVSLG